MAFLKEIFDREIRSIAQTADKGSPLPLTPRPRGVLRLHRVGLPTPLRDPDRALSLPTPALPRALCPGGIALPTPPQQAVPGLRDAVAQDAAPPRPG